MKKIIITMMMLASLQGFANGPKAPGQDGGGGGVIKRDGMYLTFGSAGMKVKLSTPQGLEQIPGLELILSILDAQERLPDTFRGKLVNAVLPSDIRRYFKIDQSQLNSQTYARLIAEYSKLWNGQVNPNNLDLAAITVANDTYLLPPFFKLNQTEQAAILFHESIWIVKPSISYADLVNAEITMQSHIEKYGTQNVYNPDLMAILGGVLENNALIIAAALKEDLLRDNLVYIAESKKNVQVSKRKTEERTVQEKYISLISLSDIGYYEKGSEEEQRARFVMQIRELMKQYPNSLFLKQLYSLRNKILSARFWNEKKDIVVIYDVSVNLQKEVPLILQEKGGGCMVSRVAAVCLYNN